MTVSFVTLVPSNTILTTRLSGDSYPCSGNKA
jgi:hypothetical protein